MKYFQVLLLFLFSEALFCQEFKNKNYNPEHLNSFNKDLYKDKILGASIDRTYKEILKNKKSKKTVVVAVIDGGIDINHIDLTGKIWINDDEIPLNGIDDDNNGNIDDINGWNFIGNKDGENIIYENFEFTRLLKRGKKGNPFYEKSLELYNSRFDILNTNKEFYQSFIDKWNYSISIILEQTSIRIEKEEDLDKIITRNELLLRAMSFLKYNLSKGRNKENAQKKLDELDIYFTHHLNFDYNPREIIGDNTEKIDNITYGNNNVISATASHGTQVAGIIAANRDNDIGINGIASNIKIMSLRVVPNGAERDKDVALSIFLRCRQWCRYYKLKFWQIYFTSRTFG
jgi:subtilisin family serine protease